MYKRQRRGHPDLATLEWSRFHAESRFDAACPRQTEAALREAAIASATHPVDGRSDREFAPYGTAGLHALAAWSAAAPGQSVRAPTVQPFAALLRRHRSLWAAHRACPRTDLSLIHI